MTARLTAREAEASLRAFTREFGENGDKMADLAGHAAMPSVLRPELVHLLRINYFLDPPQDLPYEAEACLLLSRLCTEIDEGLFVIDPALRDLLLRQLMGRHGPTRIRDVARLLWEYNGRGTPWADRPGLLEAQQLTALNFIDPARALAWLERARAGSGNGTLPVNDERWFVALQEDLHARTEALREESATLIDSIPALRELWDDLDAIGADRNAVIRVAGALGIPLSESPAREAPAAMWRIVLEAAWNTSRMPEFLELVSQETGEAKSWTEAVHEFWIRISPALRIENGNFATPPPEWQILESHRAALEKAIRATVLLVVESPAREPRIFGLGTLVGKQVVITHSSIVADALADGFGPDAATKVFAEFIDDHPVIGYVAGVQRRLQLVHAVVDPSTEFVALAADPNSSVTGLPHSLRVMREEPSSLNGRKVCVVGYPMEDSRIDSRILARVFPDGYGVLRLMPGQILGEDANRGVVFHNCFTTGGTGGSALIDVETGEVLGVHFAARYDPTWLGLKQGHAISILRFASDPRFVDIGVFETPGPEPVPELRFASDPGFVDIGVFETPGPEPVPETFEMLPDPAAVGVKTVGDLEARQGISPDSRKLGVLVVGTGWYNLPKPVELAALAVGEAIARAGCILVTGGWAGVDHIAARAFSEAPDSETRSLPGDLIQVLEANQQPDFTGQSTIVHVDNNHRSIEALRFADVVILIGGAGGTWDAFRSALLAGKLVIPFFNTGTDARRAAILLEIFGQDVPSRFLRAEFDSEEKARLAGRLLQTVLSALDSTPGQYHDNGSLLWMTETILPLAGNYLRKRGGFDEDAARIFQEFAAREFSSSKFDQFLTAFLEEPDPVWRCIAYLAIEVKVPESFILSVVNNGARELALALDQKETRPLWRWLSATRRLLDSYPRLFPAGLIGTLQNSLRAIEARTDVDPGGECKRAIHEILGKLQPASPPNPAPEKISDPYTWTPSSSKAPPASTAFQGVPVSSSASAEVWVLSGSIDKPFTQRIQPIAHTVGHANSEYMNQRIDTYRLENILSAAESFSQVSSQTSHPPYSGWIATASVNGLSIAEVLTADRVVLQVSVEKRPALQPQVTFLGTQFQNLRILGVPIDVRFDFMIASQYLAEDLKIPPTSLVATIAAPVNGFHITANRIEIPQFGVITLADLNLDPWNLQLSMVRCHLSGPISGLIEVANCRMSLSDSPYSEQQSYAD